MLRCLVKMTLSEAEVFNENFSRQMNCTDGRQARLPFSIISNRNNTEMKKVLDISLSCSRFIHYWIYSQNMFLPWPYQKFIAKATFTKLPHPAEQMLATSCC